MNTLNLKPFTIGAVRIIPSTTDNAKQFSVSDVAADYRVLNSMFVFSHVSSVTGTRVKVLFSLRN